MKNINITIFSMDFYMHGSDKAIDGIYDIYEADVLYDFEFAWRAFNGRYHSSYGEIIKKGFSRNRLHNFINESLILGCGLKGWSDPYREREVIVLWDPYKNSNVLTFILNGRFPCNKVEQEIIDVIVRSILPSDDMGPDL